MMESGVDRSIKETRPLQGKIAVVTGNERGIGAEISRALVEAGVHIVGNHVDPKKIRRQTEVEEKLRLLGDEPETVLADITDPGGRQALLNVAIQRDQHGNPTRGVDYLILNAAGGLEREKEADYAEKINVEAQIELVDLFLPHMNRGGVIVYMTSLWAHRLGEVKSLPGYDRVAETKNKAERLLRERMPKMAERGVRFGVVSGHVIKDTTAYTLFRRAYPDKLKELERTAEGGVFPSAIDMGNAVRDMVLFEYGSGDTIHVGGTNAEPL